MSELISKDAALGCFHDWIDRCGHEHTADEDATYQRVEVLEGVGSCEDAISRQAAIDSVSEYATIWMSYTDDMSASDIAQEAINSAKDTMIRILKNQPNVQPEIIRCKDCNRRDKHGCCKYWKGLAMGDIPIATDDYDFCSYAKRI